MPKDLLSELKQNNELPNVTPQSYFEEIPSDGTTNVDEFLAEIASIRKSIEQISYNVNQVKAKHCELLSTPQQNPQTKAELEELNDDIKRLSGQVRIKLKSIKESITQYESENPDSADFRIRRTQHAMTTNKFMEVMNEYNDQQIKYVDAHKARYKRQLEVAQRSVTDEELEEMLESGTPQIFTQDILADTQQARQNLADIEARHEDILKLEKSIRELHELFLDMSLLVEQQGEMINQIDSNIALTKDYAGAAKIETTKAVIYKTKSRKKKFILIGVAAGILLIIIIIILATTIK